MQKPPIESYFREHFSDESLKREAQRAGVLSAMFLFATVVLAILHPLLRNDNLISIPSPVMLTVIPYLVGMGGYEWGIRRLFTQQLKRHQDIPTFFKFANATFEISSISFIILIVSRHLSDRLLALDSPLTYIYLFFIILSTLRLNFWLSVYTGAIAGAEYIGLYFLIAGSVSEPYREIDLFVHLPLMFIIKGGLLIMAGLAAGYVSRQIRLSITDTIRATETEQNAVTLFGQQVSPQIARAVLEQKGNYQSHRMRVAVMFLDIRDFTNYATHQAPEDVMAYQNTFFGIIIRIVEQYGGVVNQFLGDGCMITFGAPVEVENPAEVAVEAGFTILREIRKAVTDELMIPTAIGIGIHLGDAVVGNIGTETRQQYSVTGNVVILAARIEQLNKPFKTQFLVSREVYESLTMPPETARALGPTVIKGVDEEIELYQLF
ncbi:MULTISPECIES: adenylate/guanylate cyclase domain-containing protein [Spirosoma]|uniref:Adenylate/guanylate cyclase domain-containing protein n=1 Tax=Spirosoma liriopis TaxID=2937440 RepID=A0ABT0HGX2_9BACT|nr:MULTISPECIES: adenylate/guanylate cyclase domain-containing protein [Spirosoma]MCK8491412.1 adenylate/guanylate cyclase domain-containing protein [Spirosoma liriopis]UHG90782.1 adenylate/guanylate cyclase domain-containing protein [Spirosoma oryzicola]